MKKLGLIFGVIGLTLLLLSGMSLAQTFTEVSSGAGMVNTSDDTGATWADYDNDGDLDIFVGTYTTVADRLFRNNGDGTFTEVASSVGITNTGYALGAAWVDYDNDGDLDLCINNYSGVRRLYQNDGNGQFTNVAASAGVESPPGGGGMAWGDYNNDGYIDLFLSLDGNNELYENDQDGTFTSVGSTAQVNAWDNSSTPIWGDYNNDGYLDLFLSVNGNNKLYANNGDATFTNVASTAQVQDSNSGRGAAWADYDNDGDLDIYQANDSGAQNVLYNNNGMGVFSEVSVAAGVAAAGNDYGVSWGDYDNDGDLDLLLTGGNDDYFYSNNGDGSFSDSTSAAGLTNSGTYGSSWGDYDNDGDLDVYVAGTTNLYENVGNVNRWLHLDLHNTVGNRIGTRVTAVTGSLRQRRDVDGGSGIYGQSSLPVEFGFGSTSTVDSLIIEWPSGQVEILTSVSTNQTLTHYEPIDVSIPNLTSLVDTVQVPIQVGNTTNAGIISADLFITFNDTVAAFLGTDVTGTLAATGWNVIENVVQGAGNIDTLKIVMFTAQDTLSGSGDLINLTFDLSGASGATPLDFAYALFNNGIPPTQTQNSILSAMGTDGTVSASPDTILPGQTVTITVVDQDENLHNGVVDSFQVLAFESVYADSEMVWLFETGPATNTFTNTLATEYNVAGTVSDSVMSVVTGDSITVVYADSIDAGGSLTTRFAYVQVDGGVDGVVTASPDTITPGKILTLTVTDADGDISAGDVDSVFVQLFTITNVDTESVWLQETGVNTGTFSGSFPTEYDTTATVADDILSVALNDSIVLAYVDSLAAAGSTVTRYDYTEVIPYDNGTLQVSHVVQAFDGRNSVRDTVRVRVFDTDLDLDVGTPDQASVTITNIVSAEVEVLALTETGNNTGVFQLRVPTIQGASGTDNDGVLTIAAWDTLDAAYFDSLTSTAVSNTLRDTVYVINVFGDVQSNDLIEGFDAAKILNVSIGAETASFNDSLAADVDGDGFLLAIDATYVSQYITSIIDRFAVQTDSTFSSPTDSLKNHPFLKPALGHPVIAFGQPLPQTDGTYLLPVQLNDREGVLSGTLQFGYDSSLQILDVIPATAFENHLFAHNSQSENLRIAFSGTQAKAQGEGDVFFIQIGREGDGPIQLTLDGAFLNGQDVLSPVEVIEQVSQQSLLPEVYALHPNTPNPFNPDTVIRYDLPEAANVQIMIYNVLGQQVRTLVSANQEAGRYQVTWQGKDDLGREVSSGIYLMRMQAASFLKTQKMMLLK